MLKSKTISGLHLLHLYNNDAIFLPSVIWELKVIAHLELLTCYLAHGRVWALWISVITGGHLSELVGLSWVKGLERVAVGHSCLLMPTRWLRMILGSRFLILFSPWSSGLCSSHLCPDDDVSARGSQSGWLCETTEWELCLPEDELAIPHLRNHDHLEDLPMAEEGWVKVVLNDRHWWPEASSLQISGEMGLLLCVGEWMCPGRPW